MRISYSLGAAPALAVLVATRLCFAAVPARQAAAPPIDQATALDSVVKAIDKQRQALHIPGASLVIVKDDKVILIKGLGLRDVEHTLPVTPDTQFAIGSSTKAFTAMTAMMSVDDGKMSLANSPKKYLPYFKLRDPEAIPRITISDLLCHRSGLDRTDIAWYTGKLDSEETIRLVASIKPTAKFGEKFQYQNVMFLTAGQCVGVAQHSPWRSVVAKRIFEPLHMKRTNTSINDMERSPDHSFGYNYDAVKKVAVRLPYRALPAIAPAGAINSNAVEMAQWLRLMLGGGVFEGKRLVSEANFAELFKKHMGAGVAGDYGYGWFLHDWHGHKVAEHGGNIDGFNAQVSLMPDQHLGFVLLTNVSASPLGVLAMETVWDDLVGYPKPAETAEAGGASVDPALEAGTYHITEANADLTVSVKAGKLVLKSTNLPETPLEVVRGRRYRVAIPGLDGVFATFRPAKDDPKDTELFFEQPGAAFVCKRALQKEAAPAFVAPMSGEELMQKVVDAEGGETNLRRHKSLTVRANAVVETQGITLKITESTRLPNAQEAVLTLYAAKKQIGSIRSYYDGKAAGSESTISPDATVEGDALNAIALGSTSFPELERKSLFKAIEITGKSKVGDEETYTVEMRPEKGAPMIDYVSMKSYRVLKRVTPPGAQSETHSDFRTVDGVLIPFVRTGILPGLGEAVSTVTSVKFDARIPETAFHSSRGTAAAGS